MPYDEHINPTTAILLPDGTRETKFREQVREALGLAWDARDEQIVAELRRLKTPYALHMSEGGNLVAKAS